MTQEQAQAIATRFVRFLETGGPGTIPRWRCDPTPTGFVIEFEERWEQDGRDWYSREMARADVRGRATGALSVYCTGDWDVERRAEHARGVQLFRP